jgi:hypothetical protein
MGEIGSTMEIASTYLVIGNNYLCSGPFRTGDFRVEEAWYSTDVRIAMQMRYEMYSISTDQRESLAAA